MQPSLPWYRRKRPRLVVTIVAAVLVVLVAVAAILTVLLHSSEKIMLDSVRFALQQPGTYEIKSGTTEATVLSDGERLKVDAKIKGMSLTLISRANMLYLKTSDPLGMLQELGGTKVPKETQTTLQIVAPQFADKWLRFDLYNESFKLAALDGVSCALDAKSLFANDTTHWQQLAARYIDHSFLTIDKKSENASTFTYDVMLDKEKLAAFGKGISSTTYGKALDGCVDEKNPLGTDVPTDVSAKIEIARGDHSLRKMTIKNASGQQTTVIAHYGSTPTITEPTNPMTVDQIAGMLMRSFLQRR